MATIKLYKKSTRQPCYRLSYRDPLTSKWRMKLLHCSREQAEEIRKQAEAKYTWYQANPHLIKESRDFSFEAVRESFLKAKHHEVSSSTIQRYRFGLKYVEKVVGADMPIGNIKQFHIDEIISVCREKLTIASTNTVLRHLSVLLNWARDRELIDRFPKIKQIKTQKQPIKYLSLDEVTSILEHSSDELADLIKLYILTGARRNELLYCEWKHIDMEKGRILLPHVKSKQKEYLYLNSQAKAILGKYRASKPRPFKWTENQTRYRYKQACETAEITSTIHDLRRTCGARLIEKEIDIFRVSKFLRHSSVRVTQGHYVDLLPSDYPAVAENIEI